MTFVEALLLSLALCVDTLVVSAATAFRTKMTYRRGLLMALILGFCQFAFPLAGAIIGDVARAFTRTIRGIPQVAECYNISGEYDYLLKIRARNMKEYNEFVINTLGTIDAIGSVQSSFVMNEIKHSYGLCL
jgi:DNA-binding Lrp family transcriptional regulator